MFEKEDAFLQQTSQLENNIRACSKSANFSPSFFQTTNAPLMPNKHHIANLARPKPTQTILDVGPKCSFGIDMFHPTGMTHAGIFARNLMVDLTIKIIIIVATKQDWRYSLNIYKNKLYVYYVHQYANGIAREIAFATRHLYRPIASSFRKKPALLNFSVPKH